MLLHYLNKRDRCPRCGSGSYSCAVMLAGELDVVTCKSCSFMWTEPIYSPTLGEINHEKGAPMLDKIVTWACRLIAAAIWVIFAIVCYSIAF